MGLASQTAVEVVDSTQLTHVLEYHRVNLHVGEERERERSP